MYIKTREDIKVGDVLTGYSTGLKVVVTAIGEKRFLYKDFRGDEKVSQIHSTTATWYKDPLLNNVDTEGLINLDEMQTRIKNAVGNK